VHHAASVAPATHGLWDVNGRATGAAGIRYKLPDLLILETMRR
jgi:hypothetical protein